MPKTFHMRLDVRGALMNWSASEFRCLRDDQGRPFASVAAAKAALLDELAKGHKFLPVGNCDAFSYENGCPGHEGVS